MQAKNNRGFNDFNSGLLSWLRFCKHFEENIEVYGLRSLLNINFFFTISVLKSLD